MVRAYDNNISLLGNRPFLRKIGFCRHPGSDSPHCISTSLAAVGKPAGAAGMLLGGDVILAAMPAGLTDNAG